MTGDGLTLGSETVRNFKKYKAAYGLFANMHDDDHVALPPSLPFNLGSLHLCEHVPLHVLNGIVGDMHHYSAVSCRRVHAN